MKMSISGQPISIKLVVRDEEGPDGTSALNPDSMDLALKAGPSRRLVVESPVSFECATRAVLPQVKVRVADVAGNYTDEGSYEVTIVCPYWHDSCRLCHLQQLNRCPLGKAWLMFVSCCCQIELMPLPIADVVSLLTNLRLHELKVQSIECIGDDRAQTQGLHPMCSLHACSTNLFLVACLNHRSPTTSAELSTNLLKLCGAVRTPSCSLCLVQNYGNLDNTDRFVVLCRWR